MYYSLFTGFLWIHTLLETISCVQKTFFKTITVSVCLWAYVKSTCERKTSHCELCVMTRVMLGDLPKEIWNRDSSRLEGCVGPLLSHLWLSHLNLTHWCTSSPRTSSYAISFLCHRVFAAQNPLNWRLHCLSFSWWDQLKQIFINWFAVLLVPMCSELISTTFLLLVWFS